MIHTAKKNNETSAQGSSTRLGPGVANVELPADVEVSTHMHGAASSITVAVGVLAAREVQHGARLHEDVAAQIDAGTVQGPPQGDHREVSVEVDRLPEPKVVLQEECDASEGNFCGQDGQTWSRDLKPWSLGWKVLWWESCRSHANHVSVRVIFCRNQSKSFSV